MKGKERKGRKGKEKKEKKRRGERRRRDTWTIQEEWPTCILLMFLSVGGLFSIKEDGKKDMKVIRWFEASEYEWRERE